MRRLPIPIGRRYGRLVVIGGTIVARRSSWHCRCDCGQQKTVPVLRLKMGEVRSCGCLKRETSAALARRRTKHGHAIAGKQPKTYMAWGGMVQRCHNPKNAAYANYGGRGIFVCDKWRSDYLAFLSDVGEPPDGSYTIDRIDNNRGYEPDNVRWATQMTQVRNRRNSLPGLLDVDGNPLAWQAAADHLAIPMSMLFKRLRRVTASA